MRYLVYDAETRSSLNVRQVGSWLYSRDPSTDVWCVSWCIVIDDVRGPISTWLPGQPIPPEVIAIAADPAALSVAFNDGFDRQIEEQILGPRYGWPIFPLARRRCAQAVALSHALPAALDHVAAALKIKTRKTAAGTKAMKLLAQPRKARKREDLADLYWHATPDKLALLYEYNRVDVEITAEIVARLGFIPPGEQAVWELDAAINARGITIDVELLDASLAVARQAAEELREALTARPRARSPAQRRRSASCGGSPSTAASWPTSRRRPSPRRCCGPTLHRMCGSS